MRRATRNGVFAVAAASGAMALALPVGSAHAAGGAAADGAAADSAGVLSGNTVQLPVHVPVNVCGNTVNVAGLLNPAAGNGCANESADESADDEHAADGSGSDGSDAQGASTDSPGVLAGNTVQLPVHLPVNLTGNSANVVGVGNATTGNHSTNTSGHHCTEQTPNPTTPAKAHPRPVTARHVAPPRGEAALAHTGSDGTLPAAAASAALILGGAVLHRRFGRRATR
ncbi:chaplin [Streptomyces sediminimaris]|uniref:chaplin n=1 Tax=Streptomyces sediminimaris TaxID=3383721 RepID=UPI00399C0505